MQDSKIPTIDEMARHLHKSTSCYLVQDAMELSKRILAPLYTRIEELEAENARLKNTDD